MRRSWPTGGCGAKKNNNKQSVDYLPMNYLICILTDALWFSVIIKESISFVMNISRSFGVSFVSAVDCSLPVRLQHFSCMIFKSVLPTAHDASVSFCHVNVIHTILPKLRMKPPFVKFSARSCLSDYTD